MRDVLAGFQHRDAKGIVEKSNRRNEIRVNRKLRKTLYLQSSTQNYLSGSSIHLIGFRYSYAVKWINLLVFKVLIANGLSVDGQWITWCICSLFGCVQWCGLGGHAGKWIGWIRCGHRDRNIRAARTLTGLRLWCHRSIIVEVLLHLQVRNE